MNDDNPNIILITFINRSGSTFLANQFSKLNNVVVCPEAGILKKELLVSPNEIFYTNIELINRFKSHIKNDRKLKFWGLKKEMLSCFFNSETNFDAFINIIKAYKKKINPSAKTIVFKNNSLFNFFNIIENTTPPRNNIKLIAVHRDPRAVFNSQCTTIGGFTNKALNKNPIITAYQWNWFINRCMKNKTKNSFIKIKYEDLISDYEITFNKILYNTIKEKPTTNKQGDLYSRIPDYLKHMHKNINKIAIKSRIDAWKENLSRYQVYLIESICAENMIKMDYQLVKPRVNPIIIFLLKIYYKFLIALKISKY